MTKDPFGFTKAINFDKLNDPKVLKELEKIFIKDEPLEKRKEFVKKIKKDSEQTTGASNGPSLPAACALAGGSRTELQEQATSAKRQAASLTRLNYNVIVSYKLKEK